MLGLGRRDRRGARSRDIAARRLALDGFEAWAQVLERGYEGLVGKDEASPYREGERGWEPKGYGDQPTPRPHSEPGPLAL
jgi:hypothetical protein